MDRAYISSFGTDQGTGFSLCSACGQELSRKILDNWRNESIRASNHNLKRREIVERGMEDPGSFVHSQDHVKCPNCGASLESGGMSFQSSGSDF